MPLFEYRCEECGEILVVLQLFGEQPEELVCEKCGSKELKKLFSTFSSLGPGSRGEGRGSVRPVRSPFS